MLSPVIYRNMRSLHGKILTKICLYHSLIANNPPKHHWRQIISLLYSAPKLRRFYKALNIRLLILSVKILLNFLNFLIFLCVPLKKLFWFYHPIHFEGHSFISVFFCFNKDWLLTDMFSLMFMFTFMFMFIVPVI